jgi:hypothetical protein
MIRVAVPVAVCLLALAACGSSSKPTVEPTTPLGQIQAAVDSSSADSPKVTNGKRTGLYVVTFKVHDNLSSGMIKAGIAMDVYDMAKHVKESSAMPVAVEFRGTFPLVDQYGNKSTGVIFQEMLLGSTIDRINYDNIDTTSLTGLENISDGKLKVNPTL